MDSVEETGAVLLGQLRVAVGLPELTFGVVEHVVVILGQRDEGDLGARGAVDGVDGDQQLSVVTHLGAHLLRVHVVLEKL